MFPFPNMQCGVGDGRAVFIGFARDSTSTGASTAIPWPAGTNEGDLALFFGRTNSGPLAPSTSGWTDLNAGTYSTGGPVRWKRLTAADLAATVNMSSFGSEIIVWVFRGLTAAAAKGSTGKGSNDGVATLSVSGFTKAATAKALVAIGIATAIATDYSLSPSLANVVASPSTPQGGSSKAKLFYTLTPADYTNGTGWTVNFGSTAWSQNDFVVIELTGT
jgi:hypothetical protein